MKLKLSLLAVIAVAAFACGTDQLTTTVSMPVKAAAVSADALGTVKASGRDQYGYNYQARIFVGPEDGADRNLDGTYWGDATYAKDHLVMKWSKGWDDARFHGTPWGPEAYLDNEYNGRVPGGSGETAHYKIIWVGPELSASQYWRPGGYDIWGQFEVVMSQGTAGGQHWWEARAVPNGYGAN